jgi:hypothetical protein
VNWFEMPQTLLKWQTLVEYGNGTLGFVNAGSYYDQVNDCNFCRKTLLHGVIRLLKVAYHNGYLEE